LKGSGVIPGAFLFCCIIICTNTGKRRYNQIVGGRVVRQVFSSLARWIVPSSGKFLFNFTIGRLEVTPNRPESAVPRTIELALLGNRTLQTLVRGNFVCFPSQAPIFGQKSRRDLQWRLAVLYFVRGWSTRTIADRYGLTRERCGQIISDWRIRAVALGYIQDVTPEGTDLARLADSRSGVAGAGTPHDSANGYVPNGSVSPDQAATAVSANNTMSQTSFAISAALRLPSSLR
jgi:hypothetical protein